jgi:hypothetical protein
LLPSVNLRFLFGEDGEIDRLPSDEPLSESPPLEDDLRLVSARMSSRLTFRSDDTGATEVSRSSVNLEVDILKIAQTYEQVATESTSNVRPKCMNRCRTNGIPI